MPISINGSGSITGLSTGGLPDGTIVPSDLSTGGPYWDSSGNVGIGTTSPSSKLTIISANSDLTSGFLQSGATTGYSAVQIKNTSGSTLIGVNGTTVGQIATNATAYSTVVGTYNSTNLHLITNDQVRVSVDTSGNVGIGTTNPAFLFDIYNPSAGTVGRFRTQGTDTNISVRNSGREGIIGADVNQSYLLNTDAYPWTIWTNNTERLRIDSTGNVGIGTGGPTAKLEISAGNAQALRLSSSSYLSTSQGPWISFNGGPYPGWDTAQIQGIRLGLNAEGGLVFYTNNGGSGGGTISEKARIDNVGRLLVGTSNARSNFRTNASSLFQIEGTTASNSSISLINNSTGDTSYLVFGRSKGTSIGSNTILSASDYIGVMSFEGSDGANFIESAAIYSQVDGTPGTNNMPGRLVFATTASGASSPTERMRIDSTGNIGFATNNFNVGQSTGAIIVSSGSRMQLGSSDSTNTSIGYSMYSTGAGAYRFYVGYAGNIYATSTSITAISDSTLKENIRDLETGINEIMKLKPRRFDWKNGDAKNVAGFIAQEVEEVLPDLVYEYEYNSSETKRGLKMGDILPTAVKALQEAITKIETLESKVATLEGKVQ